jgi:Rps23 Pro-64 3,4-dihydroxylase Tpa1-like proline 4-hydroxylase
MIDLVAELRSEPFAHTTAIQVISPDLANEALRWMESEAPWSLRIADFYEQWELHLQASDLPPSLVPLLAPSTVGNLMGAMLGPISDDDLELTEVTAHKLLAGQTIRIHNDYLEGEESHRLLIQLNRGWSDAQGGLLMLFGSPQVDDVRRLVRPLHASAVAFKISASSFHAVSTIVSGERFTLVYSFKSAKLAS